MFSFALTDLVGLIERGGVVMWPLLVLSVVGVALSLERCWFWMVTNHAGRLARVRQMGEALRRGDRSAAEALAKSDRSVYGRTVSAMLGQQVDEAVVTEVIEQQRPRLERFMPMLSTIITAAPMLGILGTVLGIIASFDVLADQTGVTDPRAVGQGIGEALITTAAGLVVSLVVLFPYNAFRAQLDRTLGRLEALAAAGQRQ